MLSRYDPFNEMLSLRNAMDQLFAQSFVNPRWWGTTEQVAPMNVCETDNGYQVDVSLPGVRPEDIDVTVEQNTLTVRGQYSQHTHYPRQAEQGQPSQQSQPSQTSQQPGQQGQSQGEQVHNWLAQEIRTGSFQRSITFPKAIDTNNIHANYENGILTITAPFSESSRARRINIGSGQRQAKEVTVESQSSS